MTCVVLHHVGDGNVPPVRGPGTVALALRNPHAIVAVLESPEADTLVEQLKSGIFPFTTKRRSTVGEIIASRAIVKRLNADTLIDSTEQGHRRRAYLAARIIYAFTGVTVLTADYPGGTYRSPPWEYVRDILAATWWKLTHRLTA